MARATRLNIIERKIEQLENAKVDPKPDTQLEPKYKEGDVCWLVYEGLVGKRVVIEEVRKIDCWYRLDIGYWVAESSLILIPQPKGYNQLNIKDKFEQDGKIWTVKDSRVPKGRDSFISTKGNILTRKKPEMMKIFGIRFIVEEVGEPISASEKRKLFPELVCETEEQKLINGWWYWDEKYKAVLLLKENGLYLREGTWIYCRDDIAIVKPAALSDLSVEIDGVKCWFVKGDNCLSIQVRKDGIIFPELMFAGISRINLAKGIAKCLDTVVICKEQWKELMKEEHDGGH